MVKSADMQQEAEQLALVLSSHGMQRMTARVLATLLFTERPHVTMAELADTLQASAGSISGSLKMLTSVGLAERVPVPASRRDHFRLRDNAWAVLFTNQNATISAMQAAADIGIAATDRNSSRTSGLPRCVTSTRFSWLRFPQSWSGGIKRPTTFAAGGQRSDTAAGIHRTLNLRHRMIAAGRPQVALTVLGWSGLFDYPPTVFGKQVVDLGWVHAELPQPLFGHELLMSAFGTVQGSAVDEVSPEMRECQAAARNGAAQTPQRLPYNSLR